MNSNTEEKSSEEIDTTGFAIRLSSHKYLQ
jgi:hypothetical protein